MPLMNIYTKKLSSQGASTRRVHPKGVVEVFAFFGSLDGPEQNKT